METDYTVQAQISTDGGETWQSFREAADFDHTDPDTRVDDIAVSLDYIAGDFEEDELPQGALWRIAAWRGLGADTSAAPHFHNGPWAGPGQEVQTQGQAYEGSLRSLGHALDRDLSPDALLKDLQATRDMLAHLTKRRDAAIRMLMKTDTKRARIADAAGLKEARLHQIKNERR